MMRHSEAMRAASWLLRNHPTLCLFAALAAVVVVLGVLGPMKVVRAADVAVEGEDFANKPDPGTIVVTDSTRGYSGNQALKFTAPVTASHTVICSQVCDVILRARGGQSGGSPTLSVNGSDPQSLTSLGVADYTFDVNLPAGTNTISITAGNTGTARNAFLDIATFPADGGGTTDTDGDGVPDALDNCPDVDNAGQRDDDGDGIGNRCDDGSTTPIDTDLDGVPDSLDNCPDVYNAGQRDDDGDGIGNRCDDGGTPPSDTDNDGVIDVDDQCPNDPGPASNNGCPITGESVSIVGAGDIASKGSADIATGDLIDARPDALVFTAGDNAYPKGSAADFTAKYEEAWGPFKARTMPSPGNHEYETPGASGYFGYFSATPAAPVPNTIENPGLTPGKGYYSYDLGSWHILSLNSNISMDIGSDQYNFVQNDLATNRALCELAYWHHPVFSSGQHGNQANARPIFELFDTQGGDLVINGHDHNYEAFKEITYLGEESESGVREIVVGTGGTGLRGPGFVQRGISEERIFNTHGIVDINLNSTDYSGTFVPVPGETATDSFEGTCEP